MLAARELELPKVTERGAAPGGTLWRLPLWSGLLVLTSLILAYPVNLRLELLALWSPDIFPNLPLFGVLFYLWSALLVLLLFTARDETTARWERLALVALAALVFRGFWVPVAPVLHQSLAHAAATKIWLEAGHIVPPGGYIDWPGLSVTAGVISLVTGLELIPAIVVQTLFVAVVMAVAAYLFLLHVLKTSLSASLACLLVLGGSQWLFVSFGAGVIGLTFMLLFLALLFHPLCMGNQPRILAALLLLLAATVTNFYGVLFMFYTTLGVWCFGLLRRDQARTGITATTVALFFIIPAAWLLYWGIDGFTYITKTANMRIGSLGFLDLFDTGLSRGQVLFGETLPPWLRIPRLFWLATLFVSGGLLWLWHLARVRRLGSVELRLVAVYTGLVLLTATAAVTLLGGASELRRSLSHGAFHGVPFLFLLLQQWKPLVEKMVLSAMASLLVLLSLPSFLGNALGIPTWTWYEPEYAGAKWLQSLYGTAKDLRIFTTNFDVIPLYFYVPDATFTGDRQTHALVSWDEEGVWQSMDEFLDKFDRFSETQSPALYVHSPKMALNTAINFGIPLEHPRWGQITDGLSNRHGKIYNNGAVVMYAGTPK